MIDEGEFCVEEEEECRVVRSDWLRVGKWIAGKKKGKGRDKKKQTGCF